MTHTMKLHPLPIELIRNKEQVIEIRLFDKKRQKLKIGDKIKFSLIDDRDKNIKVRIMDLLRRDTFSELFDMRPPEMFGGKNKEELFKVYKYYSKEDEQKYGVLGIIIKLI